LAAEGAAPAKAPAGAAVQQKGMAPEAPMADRSYTPWGIVTTAAGRWPFSAPRHKDHRVPSNNM